MNAAKKQKRHKARTSGALAACVLSITTLAACGNSEAGEASSQASITTSTIDQAMTKYGKAVEAAIKTAKDTAGTAEWKAVQEPVGGECVPGSDTSISGPEGSVWRSTKYYTGEAIPENKWPAVLAAVSQTLAPLGFKDPISMVEQPSDHELLFTGPDGATLSFGTDKVAFIVVNSGCHPKTLA